MFFLRLDETALYYTGSINQVTVKPLLNETKQKSKGGSECLAVKQGDILITSLGFAKICSILWYRGNCKLVDLPDDALESWAIREGFSGFYAADMHFTEKYGSDWIEQDMMSLKFRIEGVSYD